MESKVVCGPMVAGGDSIVKQAGQKVLFVDGGLPGETVAIEITKDSKDLMKGRAVQVIEPSLDRVSPSCAKFHEGCGGCQWGHMSDSGHATNKTDIVTDALTRIAHATDVPVAFSGSVPRNGYRTSVRLGVHGTSAGFRARGTHDVLASNACTIVHPELRELITDGKFGSNTEVTLRVSATNGVRIAIVDDRKGVKLPSDVAIVTPESEPTAITEVVRDREFRISPHSFFQSGLAAAELLSATVIDFVPAKVGWLVDAYSGVGLLGAALADARNCRVTAVEQQHSSVVDARFNLSDIEADILQAEVATIELSTDEQPDVVVADPSRTGLGPSATKTLASLGAATFILVSCDPASLARDVTLLDQNGYTLQQVKVIDLFPQTPHVETVSLFVQR